jgi:cyclase
MNVLSSRSVVPGTLLVVVSWMMVVHAQGEQRPRPAPAANVEASELEVLQLRPNFYMIAGAGGNIAVQVGEDGVLVTDTGTASRVGAVLAAIKKIAPAPIRYVANTSADPDHVGGNEAVVKAGQTLFGGWTTGNAAQFGRAGASVVATERVLHRMGNPDGERPAYPEAAWPTEGFYLPRKYMFFNGEAVEFLQQPAAHTDGDSVVFFRRSDVIVTGDILDLRHFPVIDVARGGSIQGEIAALNRMVEIAVPSVPLVSREAGTLVIPGHGHVGDQIDLAEYRDMLTIIRDRVQELMKAGRTLDQIKAATPARGYTGRYGRATGAWSTAQFLEAVHHSLLKEKS